MAADDRMDDRGGDAASRLIGGAFDVNFARPLDGAAGGLPAWEAIDRREGRGGLMAVEVARQFPARAGELVKFQAGPVAGVLSPLAHGVLRAEGGRGGRTGMFVICQAPTGRALLAPGVASFRPWDEGTLLRAVLRPAALALEQLHVRGITHRAIRPQNLFRLSGPDPVVLGCAWAAPPASMQDAIYEPPYSAMCLPAGRGNGSTADDVYALGVTILVLALGRLPLAGAEAAAVVQQKIDLGSYAALVGEERLPPAIQDLVRGMLAEDPEHRPAPALLADTEVARGRRVAARPPRRAQKVLEIGAQGAWTARSLAFALASEPAAGTQALRNGGVDRWLRRSLGDSALAARLDEVVRLRAAPTETAGAREDAALVMRASAILDPLAPLCWDGIALWPDGLGPALAAADGEDSGVIAKLADIIGEQAAGSWGTARAERSDPANLRLDASQYRGLLRQRGFGGGVPRLRYVLNPLLPCRSAMLQADCVVRLSELLPVLERLAGGDGARGFTGIDHEIAAFIAARSELAGETDLMALGEPRRADQHAVAALRLLASVQDRMRGGAVPALARWFGQRMAPALQVFQGRTRRQQRETALAELSSLGRLSAMLGLIDDPEGRAVDRRDQAAALARVQTIDRRIDGLMAAADGRAALAARLGQEGMAAAALLALVWVVMTVLFA